VHVMLLFCVPTSGRLTTRGLETTPKRLLPTTTTMIGGATPAG